MLCLHILLHNLIPFIILMECFIFPAPSLPPPRLPGRQEGQLRAAVPLPKSTASKDEGPLFIALPGLLLSDRFHFTYIEKVCSVHFRAMPAPQSCSLTMVKLVWSLLKLQLDSLHDFQVFKFKLFSTFQKHVENLCLSNGLVAQQTL